MRANNGALPEVLNSHLTDLICLPIILMICLNAIRFLKRNAEFQLGILPIAILVIEYSLIFELIAPYYSNLYTADMLDILMYFMGAIFFYFIQAIKKKSIVKNSLQTLN